MDPGVGIAFYPEIGVDPWLHVPLHWRGAESASAIKALPGASTKVCFRLRAP
jgi:hypothetical protein